MKTFWVRHGESTWNRAGLMQGQTFWPRLTSRGQEQAREVAEELSESGVRWILSSDLGRASQTADLIATRLRLAVSHTSLLRERCWGIFEGLPIERGTRVDAALAPCAALPGGESREDVAKRLRLLPDLLFGRESAVVVTHGDVLREAMWMWSTDPTETVLDNGCIVRITVPEPARPASPAWS